MSTDTTTDEPILDRAAFLANGNDRRFKVESIPGLGRVRIRSLKESERSKYEADLLDDDGDLDCDELRTAKRRLIVLTVVDGNGETLLSDRDVDALGEKDGAIFNALYKECAAFSGITESDLAALVGNSNGTRDDGSR